MGGAVVAYLTKQSIGRDRRRRLDGDRPGSSEVWKTLRGSKMDGAGLGQSRPNTREDG